MLTSGEQLVLQRGVQSLMSGTMGLLLVTNRRVVYESLNVHRTTTEVDIPLDLVRDAHVGLGAAGESILRLQSSRGEISFRTPDANALREAIARGKAQTGPAGDSARSGAAVPLVLLHCRQCGTLSPAGTQRCSSCGAAL